MSNDIIGELDSQPELAGSVNNYEGTNGYVPWSNVSEKPTTTTGYGINSEITTMINNAIGNLGSKVHRYSISPNGASVSGTAHTHILIEESGSNAGNQALTTDLDISDGVLVVIRNDSTALGGSESHHFAFSGMSVGGVPILPVNVTTYSTVQTGDYILAMVKVNSSLLYGFQFIFLACSSSYRFATSEIPVHFQNIENDISGLETSLAAKISNPLQEGTAGQALLTNGSGTRYWGSPIDGATVKHDSGGFYVVINGTKSYLASDADLTTAEGQISTAQTDINGLKKLYVTATVSGNVASSSFTQAYLTNMSSTYAQMVAAYNANRDVVLQITDSSSHELKCTVMCVGLNTILFGVLTDGILYSVAIINGGGVLKKTSYVIDTGNIVKHDTSDNKIREQYYVRDPDLYSMYLSNDDLHFDLTPDERGYIVATKSSAWKTLINSTNGYGVDVQYFSITLSTSGGASVFNTKRPRTWENEHGDEYYTWICTCSGNDVYTVGSTEYLIIGEIVVADPQSTMGDTVLGQSLTGGLGNGVNVYYTRPVYHSS